MATGAAHSPATPSNYEAAIRTKLREASRDLKWFELLSLTAKLVATGLLVLLGVVIVDHWIWPLPPAVRLITLVACCGVAIWYGATRIAPLLVLKLNPVYVARRIEQASPDLKNSLVNCLTYRSGHSSLARFVTRALQQKAATDLARIPPDAAVNRRAVLRAVYALAIAAVLFAAYTLVSPKSTWQSVRRVLQPWAGIVSPTRVEILKVEPGDTRVLFGDRAAIRVEVAGLRSGEPVTLIYDSKDRKVSGRRQPMASKDGRVFTATVPSETNRGIESDIRYHIEAGDARSREFVLSVEPEPALLVERLEYEFPTYVRQESRTVSGQGAIRAIDGTKVTIHARANQPVASARFLHRPANAEKPRPFAMRVEDKLVSYSFRLDARYGLRQAYQLDMQTTSGRKARKTVVYDIEVVPDLPPEVEIRLPKQTPIQVPANGSLPISVRAIDPDFGLSKVAIQFAAEQGASVQRTVELLPDNWDMASSFTGQYVFKPAEWRLAVGDRIRYRAFAQDNRSLPRRDDGGPNEAYSSFQVIVVGAAVEQPEPPSAEDSAQGHPSKTGEQPQSGATSSDQPRPAQAGDEPAEESEQPPSGAETETPESPDPAAPQSPDHQQSAKTSPPSSDAQEPSEERSKGEPSDTDPSPEPSSDSESELPSEPAAAAPQESSASTAGAQQQGADQGESASGAQEPAASPDSAAGPSGSDAAESGSDADATAPPTHDGDVFERALEYLKQKQKSGSEPQQTPQGERAAGGSDSSESEPGASSDKPSAEQQPPPASGASDEQATNREPKQPAENPSSPPRPNPADQDAEASAAKGSEGSAQRAPKGATGDNARPQEQPMDANDRPRTPGPESPAAEQPSSSDQRPGGNQPAERPRQTEGESPSGGQRKESSGGETGAPDPATGGSQSSSSEKQPGEGSQAGGASSKSSPSSSATKQPDGTTASDADAASGEESGKSSAPSSTGEDGSQEPMSSSKAQPTAGDGEGGGNQASGAERKSAEPNQASSTDAQAKPGSSSNPRSERGSPSSNDDTPTEPNRAEAQRSESANGGKGEQRPDSAQSTRSAKPNGDEARPSDARSGERGDERAPRTSGTGAEAPEEGEPDGARDSASAKSSQGSGRSSPSSAGDSDSAREGGDQGQPTPSGEGGQSSSGSSGSPGESGAPSSQGGQPQSGQGAGQASESASSASPNAPSSSGQSTGTTPGSPSGQPGGSAGSSPGGGATDRQGPAGNQLGAAKTPTGLDGAPADAANEEYARRVTNLVLDYLKDQQDNPDPELLKRLKWTPEELRRFIDRWEAMRRLEQQGDDAAKRKLQRLYRSLGLHPGGDQRRAEGQRQDRQRGLSDAVRTEPPSSYADKFRAYKRSVSQ